MSPTEPDVLSNLTTHGTLAPPTACAMLCHAHRVSWNCRGHPHHGAEGRQGPMGRGFGAGTKRPSNQGLLVWVRFWFFFFIVFWGGDDQPSNSLKVKQHLGTMVTRFLFPNDFGLPFVPIDDYFICILLCLCIPSFLDDHVSAVLVAGTGKSA